ncbi:MAG: NUDIX hydrolase [Alphaproteobacteria bacterium]
MSGPENLRCYGVLLRGGLVLISAEKVAGREVLKFPGGGVEPGETPEAALVREFMEECSIEVRPVRLLHVPGTLLSPWTHTNYTPVYYLVDGDGDVITPAHEPVEMRFLAPEAALASGRLAEPEILALRRAIGACGP